MAIAVSLILCCLVLTLYVLSIIKYNYWYKRNVVHPKPIPIFGNYFDYITLRRSIQEVVSDICKRFPKEPYFGVYYGTKPTLIVQDPEYIKQILTKNFYYFSGREADDYGDREAITKTLFFSGGNRWKNIRQILSPLYSSNKMKKMFYLIEECCNVFDKLLDKVTTTSVDVRSLIASYTIDCIGSCAFGVQTNAMTVKDNNPYLTIGNKFFEASNIRGFKTVLRAIWPNIFYKLDLKLFPPTLIIFFNRLLVNVFEERNHKTLGRHDFIDLVLTLKQNKYITGHSINDMMEETENAVIQLDNDFLSGQCVTFFAAGYDTSATTLTFLLYELAKNPDKQKLAIEEVDNYFKRHEKLEYDCVFKTPYLEACISEALRLYPVLGVLTRELVEDFTLPSGVFLNKGIRVHIPVYHLQRNPDFFPNPDQFRPERFLGAEKDNIVSYTYMPFGEGPRICIGKRFAKMQMTAGLLTILKKCHIDLAEDTISKVEYEPRAIITQTIEGIRLKFTPRVS